MSLRNKASGQNIAYGDNVTALEFAEAPNALEQEGLEMPDEPAPESHRYLATRLAASRVKNASTPPGSRPISHLRTFGLPTRPFRS